MVKLLNIVLSVTFVSSLVSALPVQKRQETVDEFLGRALRGGSDLELDSDFLEKRLNAAALAKLTEKFPQWQTIAKTVGIGLAAQGAAYGGWKATKSKEAQDALVEKRSFNDIETRGNKTNYAYLGGILLLALNAFRAPAPTKTRGLDESINQDIDLNWIRNEIRAEARRFDDFDLLA